MNWGWIFWVANEHVLHSTRTAQKSRLCVAARDLGLSIRLVLVLESAHWCRPLYLCRLSLAITQLTMKIDSKSTSTDLKYPNLPSLSPYIERPRQASNQPKGQQRLPGCSASPNHSTHKPLNEAMKQPPNQSTNRCTSH